MSAAPHDALVRVLVHLLTVDERSARDVVLASWHAALRAHQQALAAQREARR